MSDIALSYCDSEYYNITLGYSEYYNIPANLRVLNQNQNLTHMRVGRSEAPEGRWVMLNVEFHAAWAWRNECQKMKRWKDE
jgi:hypothetical protein